MKFSKMHSLGNDFMIVDAITQNISFSPILIRQLADRHLGVGFDQLLVVELPYDSGINFHYRIFNADGREVSQCGNGACCLAYFTRLVGLTNKHDIHISTANRRMLLSVTEDKLVCVNMGEPNFEPSSIPFKTNKLEKTYTIQVLSERIRFSVVSLGNPHCVVQIDDINNNIYIQKFGSVLESHECFPEQANIGFMQIIKRNFIRLRVYERGVGETQSCGSGACAAVAVGINLGLLEKKVHVELIGGQLNVFWKGPGNPIYMFSSATHVYDGYIPYI